MKHDSEGVHFLKININTKKNMSVYTTSTSTNRFWEDLHKIYEKPAFIYKETTLVEYGFTNSHTHHKIRQIYRVSTKCFKVTIQEFSLK